MTRPKGKPKKRLNLDLIMSDWARLDELCLWSDKGYAEMIRTLIRAWREIGMELREGGKLILRRTDGSEVEIVTHMKEDRL